MKKLAPIALVFFLFSCQHPAKQSKSVYSSHAIVYKNLTGDKIVFLEDYYNTYFEAIKTNYANRNQVYEQLVQDSIFQKYFTKSEYAQVFKNVLSSPIRDTAGLLKYISAIVDNRIKIEQLITQTLADDRKYLKNDSVTIYVLPSNEDISQVIQGKEGVIGLTAGSRQIVLTIDPMVNNWQQMLAYTLTREYEHAYWTKTNFKAVKQSTLLDWIVSEGMADSYAHLVYPDFVGAWTKAISGEIESKLWTRIKPELDNTNIAFQYNVMYGSKNEYPYWGGYELGYHIVQSAWQKHPELTPVEWVNMPAKQIFEMSDYK